jgi:hypothetical protein
MIIAFVLAVLFVGGLAAVELTRDGSGSVGIPFVDRGGSDANNDDSSGAHDEPDENEASEARADEEKRASDENEADERENERADDEREGEG